MNKYLRLGLFVVAALLLFAGAVFLIGGKSFLFSSTYDLTTGFKNVAGLLEGAEVRVGGLRQGIVKRIDLPRKSGEDVSVVMQLHSGTRGIIRKDSIAAIESEGLLGDKYIEITFGSGQAAEVHDGDRIGSAPPLDLADVVKKANLLLDTTRGAIENLDQTTANLKSISGKIDEGKGTMGAFVNDRGVYRQVNAGATAFAENMEALKHNFLVRGFFKNRGYDDPSELTAHRIARRPSGTPEKKFVFEASKIFDKPDKAKLKNEKALKEVGNFLENNKFGMVLVTASAGSKGDTEKAKLLTDARATVVREYLVEHFKVDDTRVKTLGLGKSLEGGEEPKLQIEVYPDRTATARK